MAERKRNATQAVKRAYQSLPMSDQELQRAVDKLANDLPEEDGNA